MSDLLQAVLAYSRAHPPTALLGLTAASVVAYTVLKIIYNVYFHPLSKYPGPKLWAATRIPYSRNAISGYGPQTILRLHQKYGDIVRVGPTELSYLRPDAWKSIMGHRKAGEGENGKDIRFYNNPLGIVASDRQRHSRQRRVLAHGFSAQKMLEQQPLIRQYVDLLIQRLHERCEGGKAALNFVAWYNYTTFDVIGDLSFGESFHCLDKSDMHPWVRGVFGYIKAGTYIGILRWIYVDVDRLLKPVLRILLPARVAHTDMVKALLDKRLATDTDRPDFIASMTTAAREPLELEEVHANASTLVIAGSETTATVMSAATYLLSMNPRVMKKLEEEVLSVFTSEDEIDLLNVQKLKYMLAVLDETMRIFPATPSGLPRVIQPGGDTICGKYVPEGTTVAIHPWALYHSPTVFHQPDEFIPERWLGEDKRFDNDQHEAFKPFSHGSRDCIGKNLAYSEMRMIMARMIWNFEIKLDEGSKDWMEKSRVYFVWDKGPMYGYLVPRAH